MRKYWGLGVLLGVLLIGEAITELVINHHMRGQDNYGKLSFTGNFVADVVVNVAQIIVGITIIILVSRKSKKQR